MSPNTTPSAAHPSAAMPPGCLALRSCIVRTGEAWVWRLRSDLSKARVPGTKAPPTANSTICDIHCDEPTGFPAAADRPQPPFGHQPPQNIPRSIATSSAARSAPVCPPLMIFMERSLPNSARRTIAAQGRWDAPRAPQTGALRATQGVPGIDLRLRGCPIAAAPAKRIHRLPGSALRP
jgi:hypothetical protein